MLLANVVDTSRRIAETTKRLEKVNLLAGLLKQLHGEEIEIGVGFLSGSTRQGRIGIGYATLRDAITSAAENPSLADPLLKGAPPIRAEVVYAVRHELALTLEDVLARRIGLEMHSWRMASDSLPMSMACGISACMRNASS